MLFSTTRSCLLCTNFTSSLVKLKYSYETQKIKQKIVNYLSQQPELSRFQIEIIYVVSIQPLLSRVGPHNMREGIVYIRMPDH